MHYPSFKDHKGITWQVVTIHIVVSSAYQVELECQTPGQPGTKTFGYSVDTGTISQYSPDEMHYSVPDETQALCKALQSLFTS